MPDPDNQLRWLNTCCPDWEGGFSMNPCCPVSVSACVSLSKVGKLCGAVDPDDDPNARRPKAYQNVTNSTTQSGGYDGGGGVDPCEFGAVSKVERSGSYSTNTTTIEEYSVNEEGGCESEVTSTTIFGSSFYNRTETCCSCCGGCPTTQISCSSFQNEDGTWTGSTTTTFFDGEETTTTTEPNNELCPFNYENPTVYETTYTEEDTESAALSRVDEWTQSNGCVTSDYRVDGYSEGDKLGVSKTTVKHEAVVTGLVIGFCYEGVIPIERAFIDFDEHGNRIPPEPEDWLPFSLTAIPSFRAEQVFQTFGQGTLNVSDDDFINANFSLDPYDYPSYFPVDPETGILIDPDALVLTPFSDLPESKVYDYRVLPAVMRRLECDEI
jgi:hypothetical protein